MLRGTLSHQNMTVDSETGTISKHGTFADVEARLDALFPSSSVAFPSSSSLFLVGALERDNGWGDGDEAVEAGGSRVIARERKGGRDPGEDSDGRCVGWSLVTFLAVCLPVCVAVVGNQEPSSVLLLVLLFTSFLRVLIVCLLTVLLCHNCMSCMFILVSAVASTAMRITPLTRSCFERA